MLRPGTRLRQMAIRGRAMAGVSAAWTPMSLPGTPREWLAGPDWCYTDLAATVPAGDTDPISAWVDRWQGTTVSQSDPLKRPTLRLVGGKWAVRFDGVNDYLTNAAYTALSGVGGFVSAAALAPNNVTSNQVAVYPGSAGGILQLSTNLFYCYSSGSVYASTPAATGRRLVSVFDGSATGNANRLRAWVDGVQGSLTFFGSPGTTSGVGSGLTVGDTPASGSAPLGGDMYSLVLSAATPDAAAIAALDAYLAGVM